MTTTPHPPRNPMTTPPPRERRDAERAALQRELAAHERQGAELERRWAELVTPETRQPPGTAADPPL